MCCHDQSNEVEVVGTFQNRVIDRGEVSFRDLLPTDRLRA